MVGYRNGRKYQDMLINDFIRHSDGGVSEQSLEARACGCRLYQAFRWWGIGTETAGSARMALTLSGIPMVGYRN